MRTLEVWTEIRAYAYLQLYVPPQATLLKFNQSVARSKAPQEARILFVCPFDGG